MLLDSHVRLLLLGRVHDRPVGRRPAFPFVCVPVPARREDWLGRRACRNGDRDHRSWTMPSFARSPTTLMLPNQTILACERRLGRLDETAREVGERPGACARVLPAAAVSGLAWAYPLPSGTKPCSLAGPGCARSTAGRVPAGVTARPRAVYLETWSVAPPHRPARSRPRPPRAS